MKQTPRTHASGPPLESNAEPAVERQLARFAALADPARLRLLALLDGEELGVGELAEIVQLPASSPDDHGADVRWRLEIGEGGAGKRTSTPWRTASCRRRPARSGP